MAEKKRRKGGGGKLSRSETVTVRLDPKQRYLAELAARKQRRTLSSFIEWAIEESLRTVHFDNDKSIADESRRLWDVDEPDRFAMLALSYDQLLTHEEQVLWKLICSNGFLWRGGYDLQGEWGWEIKGRSLMFDRLRDNWHVFVQVAKGEIEKEALPTWSQRRIFEDEDDDEIPI